MSTNYATPLGVERSIDLDNRNIPVIETLLAWSLGLATVAKSTSTIRLGWGINSSCHQGSSHCDDFDRKSVSTSGRIGDTLQKLIEYWRS